MNRGQIRQRSESALQDSDNRHWSDDDLNRYINDAQREFVRITKQPTTTATLSLGPASDKSGTIAVDGRTITATSTAHGFSVGDAIYFTGFAPVAEYDDQTFIVRSKADNTFVCILDQTQVGSTISDASGSFRKIGPNYTKPSGISEINSVSLDGVELEILSEGEVNALAFQNSTSDTLFDGQFGLVPNPFDSRIVGSNTIPRWRDQQGEVQAVILTHRTADTFRIYPVPYQLEQMYIDEDATSKIYKDFEIRGVINVTDMSSDTANPQINDVWHEALIFGSLERAYLKETNLRNVDKSAGYKNKFDAVVRECQLQEGVNSLTFGGGRNEPRMRIAR